MKIKYDYRKLSEILLDEYRKKYGTNGNPSKTLEKLIDCINDAFMDEWSRSVSEISTAIQNEAVNTMERANRTLKELREEIDKNQQIYDDAKEAQAIHDERVVDALKAYRMIIDMDFDTPQQRLQNIQNASYFIWALYAKESPANMFLKEITDVKDEDATDFDKEYRGVVWN